MANDSATNERDEMKLRFSDHGCQEPPQAPSGLQISQRCERVEAAGAHSGDQGCDAGNEGEQQRGRRQTLTDRSG
jgi:hypothetical protein